MCFSTKISCKIFVIKPKLHFYLTDLNLKINNLLNVSKTVLCGHVLTWKLLRMVCTPDLSGLGMEITTGHTPICFTSQTGVIGSEGALELSGQHLVMCMAICLHLVIEHPSPLALLD